MRHFGGTDIDTLTWAGTTLTHATANKDAWKQHAAEALFGTGVQASRPVHANQTAPASGSRGAAPR